MLYINTGGSFSEMTKTNEPVYLQELREEKRRIEAAIEALEGPVTPASLIPAPIPGSPRLGRPGHWPRKRKPMSLETRAKMAKAQRERWSKARKNAA